MEIENASFTLLVFNVNGGMGRESKTFFKRLAEMVAEKRNTVESRLQSRSKIYGQTAKFARTYHFLGIRKVLNLGFKAVKQLQNENHTEDWALGSHPRDNGHVTH